MKRNYGLDLMRVFLCLCVITLHSYNYFGIDNDYATLIPCGFLLQANGLFYMLSGYFNLEKEFNSDMDIKKFYKNKFIYTLLPFLAFLLVWGVWDYIHTNGSFNILGFLAYYYEIIMNSGCDGHMWFLYPLFGLLLSTPFLSKMLHNMDEKELKILWYIALGWNFVSCYLCRNLDIEFRYLGWFLDGWPIFYIAGYCYKHVIAKESKVKWLILGILGFVVTNAGYIFYDSFTSAYDVQPMFIIFCMSCLMFWDKAFNIKNEKICKAILFLSKNTFFIYLFHIRALEYAIRKLAIIDGSLGIGFVVIITTFIFALIASIVANFLMKPIQKFLDKIWLIKE